jgi:cleavage and polyadenylation specificity factor subunit 2
VFEVEVLMISSFSRHLEFFPNPQMLPETYSSKDPKPILAVPASFSHGPSRSLFAGIAAVPDNVILLTFRGEEGTLGQMLFERWNKSRRAEDKWDKGKLGSSVMLDGSLDLCVGLRFYLALFMRALMLS